MFSKNIPFIALDNSYNVVHVHPAIKEKYSGLLVPGFFRNILGGYEPEYFAQPVEISLSPIDMSDVKLVFVQDSDMIKCYPVKSERYSSNGMRNVHYQLREPISSIFAMMPVLADNINKGDSLRAVTNLETINLQSYKLLKNVSNISLASKILAGSLPLCDIIDFSDLMENLISAVKTVERNVEFDCDIDKNVFITANSNFITTALLNLISNSINFRTDENVKITIKLTKREQKAVFTYSDNSKGIKDEHLSSVFRPYFSKDPFADGEADPSMGLGLFIVKSAFEQARGNILLTSSFGNGVKYTISLPMAEGQTDVMKSSVTDFLLNRYSELFVQLCDSCQLPTLK